MIAKCTLKKQGIFSLGLIAGLFSMASVQAQFNMGYQPWENVPVTVNNNQLPSPWAGGFNAPQFSTVDFDLDGQLDLFVFDRQGNVVKTFLYGGTPNATDFTHAPQYESSWPKLDGFALFADYNGDGKQDLFTYELGSITAYRNDSDTEFKLTKAVRNQLPVLEGNLRLPMPLLPIDMPSFIDADNDGDLDIFAFGSGSVGVSNAVTWYRNLSRERYGHSDSLVFEIGTECWGQFTESFSTNEITTGVGCKRNGSINRHAGSNLLVLDLNDDGLNDVLIGDISNRNVIQLTNEGDQQTATMAPLQDTAFPSNSVSVDLTLFPGMYSLDANHDNKRDLIVAQSQFDGGENLTCSWFYTNISNNAEDEYSFTTDQFLVDEMIEVGASSVPVLVDLNGDGLLDILVGTQGLIQTGGDYIAGLHLYLNVGTAQQPAFELSTTDFDQLTNLLLSALHPALGDLDNDGDLDMVLGESQGTLLYFERTGAPGDLVQFTLMNASLGNIDVGLYSAPTLVDLDQDQDLDLLVGNRGGTLDYFENTGSASSPSFAATPTIEDFGGIDVEPLCCEGFSKPWVTSTMDSSNDRYLFVGAKNGRTVLYGPLPSNPNFDMNLVLSRVDSIVTSQTRTAITGADLNGDGKTELMLGEYGGGIKLMRNLIMAPLGIQPVQPLNIKLFPNPVKEQLTVRWEQDGNAATIRIVDLLGRVQFEEAVQTQESETTIDLQHLPSGAYILQLSAGNQVESSKIFKR